MDYEFSMEIKLWDEFTMVLTYLLELESAEAKRLNKN